MTETRTVVTVHPNSPDLPPVHHDADDYGIPAESMALNIVRRGAVIATWAPGTWERAEVAERIPDFELRQDEPAAPAEPEEPAAPGTFEVYEDNAGKYRFRLLATNGLVIATGQAYSTRKGAQRATEVVQRAAKGAPIVDVDGEGR